MVGVERLDGGPRSAIVVGAGIVGLSTAWFLQERGGHGMWGLAHGPVTGRLLAEYITTGKQPEALRDFDPLRRSGR